MDGGTWKCEKVSSIPKQRVWARTPHSSWPKRFNDFVMHKFRRSAENSAVCQSKNQIIPAQNSVRRSEPCFPAGQVPLEFSGGERIMMMLPVCQLQVLTHTLPYLWATFCADKSAVGGTIEIST